MKKSIYLLAIVIIAMSSARAFAWAATMTGDVACSDIAGVWIDFPEGVGTFYAYGTYGGATIKPVFQTIDGVTAKNVDDAASYTSSMTKPIRIDFGSGQRVCANLSGSSGTTSIKVEIHPLQTRTQDGNLKYRY